MRVAIGVSVGRGREETIDYVLEAERLGVDSVWVAETWGADAISQIAYLIARTSRIKVGAGVLPVGARSPALLAMSAASLTVLSEGRFILGLGSSGPQVMEGWHGVPFNPPLTRLRETVEIVRTALRGERLTYAGKVYQLPLPGGEGRPIRLGLEPCEVPIYLATLGPRGLELTGEIADGWLGTSFLPAHAETFFAPIRAGAERAGRSFEAIDRAAGGALAFDDDVPKLIGARKPGFAFQIGAMGSPRHNFYKDAYERQGFSAMVDEVQKLWLEGKREAAAAAVPDEFVLGANLLGTEAMVRDRIQTYRDAGVTTLRVAPEGETVGDRVQTLGRLMDLVHAL